MFITNISAARTLHDTTSSQVVWFISCGVRTIAELKVTMVGMQPAFASIATATRSAYPRMADAHKHRQHGPATESTHTANDPRYPEVDVDARTQDPSVPCALALRPDLPSLNLQRLPLNQGAHYILYFIPLLFPGWEGLQCNALMF